MWSLVLFILLTLLTFIISSNKNTSNPYDSILYNPVSDSEEDIAGTNTCIEVSGTEQSPNGDSVSTSTPIDSSIEQSSLDDFTQDDVLKDSDFLINDILGG